MKNIFEQVKTGSYRVFCANIYSIFRRTLHFCIQKNHFNIINKYEKLDK